MHRDEKEQRGWSPYLAGALAGLLIVASVWVTGKYFGASTTFVRATGLIEQQFSPNRISGMEYFIKEVPKVDWQFLFVVGIFFGALIASTTSRSFQLRSVPAMWEERFGHTPIKRGVVAFVGGILAMFGARLADG